MPIKIGDYVRTGLEEVGTVIERLPEIGMLLIEDWEGDTFLATEGLCTLVGEDE